MTISPWTYWVGELRTGRLLTELPTFSDSWAITLNDSGSINVGLELGDPDVAFLQTQSLLTPYRSFLAVSRGNHVFNAGPVTGHNYDPINQLLQVSAGGLWAYWDKRFIHPAVSGVNVVLDNGTVVGPSSTTRIRDAVSTFKNLSSRGVAAAIVQQAMGDSVSDLPVDTQDYEEETGTESRTYYGYDFKSVGQALRDLSQEDTGPDMRFDPSFDDNQQFVSWTMNIGNPTLGNTDPTWRYEDGGNLRALNNVTLNGSTMSNRTWSTGNGSQKTLNYAVKQNDSALVNYPLLESLITRPTETSTTILQRLANADAALNSTAQQMWTVRVSTDDNPPVESIRPGDTAKFTITNDPYLGSVVATARILSISYPGPSAGGDQVDLTLGSVSTVKQ